MGASALAPIAEHQPCTGDEVASSSAQLSRTPRKATEEAEDGPGDLEPLSLPPAAQDEFMLHEPDAEESASEWLGDALQEEEQDQCRKQHRCRWSY